MRPCATGKQKTRIPSLRGVETDLLYPAGRQAGIPGGKRFCPLKNRPSRKIILYPLLLLMVSVLFVYHSYIYWEWTEDDAFISYRYSQNFAAGRGLVFNPGERVEGYSNFLWVMLMAAGLKAGLEPILFSKVIGLTAGVISLILSWVLARRLIPGGAWQIWLAPIYFSLSPLVARHSVSGLESSLFALLIISSILVAADLPPPPSAKRRLAPARTIAFLLLLLALSLTRCEGPAIALVILITRLIFTGTAHGKRALRGRIGEPILFCLFFCGYYLCRWGYFGCPFANTYYCKVNIGLKGIIDGAQYTLNFMRDNGGVLFIGLALVPAFITRHSLYWMCLAVLAAYQAFIVLCGGDWMYHYRFFSHLLPLICALMAAGLAALFTRTGPGAIRGTCLKVLAIILLVTAAAGITNTELQLARAVLPALQTNHYLSQNYRELGLWFKEHSAPRATIAISDVGAVGYYSERRIIDMFGLIDSHIARVPGRTHYKTDPRYILSQQPDYIVLVSSGDLGTGRFFRRPPDAGINAFPGFRESYELVRRVPQYWQNEFVLVYRRQQ